MRPSFVILVAVLETFAGHARAVDPPAISDPILLDHGYRYAFDPAWPERTAIALGDSLVLLAYSDMDDGILAALHGPRGERIGTNLVRLGIHEVAFDVSDLDSLGWKFVSEGSIGRVDRPHAIIMRNVDRRTLEVTPGELSLATSPHWDDLRYPTIARYAGGHAVAWLQQDSLRLVRVNAGLELIDDSPITISPHAKLFAMAMTNSAGMLVWFDGSAAVWAQPLGADALPSGVPVRILWTDETWGIDVARLGSNWLVALKPTWREQMLILDPSGVPIHSNLLDHDYALVLSVCGSDSTGLVVFNDGDVRAFRVAADASLMGDPILLDRDLPADLWQSNDDLRKVACAWTGSAFVTMWYGFRGPPTAKRDSTTTLRGGEGPENWPIFATWQAEDGALLRTEPLQVSRGAIPSSSEVCTQGGRTLVLMADEAGERYFHTLFVDPEGQVVECPRRFRSPVWNPPCYWDDCSMCSISRPDIRPWGYGFASVYSHSDSDYYEYYSYSSSSIVLDMLSQEGDSLRRVSIGIGHGYDTRYSVTSHGFAARAEDALLVFGGSDGEGGQPSWVKAELFDPQGNRMRGWTVVSDSTAADVAVVAASDGYLVLWSQQNGRAAIEKAIVSPLDDADGIVGTPILPPGWYGRPTRLIAGPEVNLCLFVGGSDDFEVPGDGNDLFAIRLGPGGTPLDPTPIPIWTGPGTDYGPEGVWDGNHFLVTWRVWDGAWRPLQGCRIGANGVVVDNPAFYTDIGAWHPSMTSDGAGKVTFGYGTCISILDDPIPLELDDEPWIDDPLETEPSVLRIGRVVPNPARGTVRLDLDLPRGTQARVTVFDASGRRTAVHDLEGPIRGTAVVWDGRGDDGRRMPAGAYFLRIDAGEMRLVRRASLLR